MSFLEDPAGLVPDPERSGFGRISLVGAGPGAVDLLTLRAVRRLQEADIVFFDRLTDPAALDLAPVSAARVYVGKDIGAHSWPQARISAAIVAAALSGQRVVRLKSGDPSVFGRAAEEISAARAFGIGIEIIPGITAASAAAASLCHPLTERGQTDRVVFATGTSCSGDLPDDIAGLVHPGTTLVFYMAMQRLSGLTAALRLAGVNGSQPVTIAARVSSQDEHCLDSTVDRMAEDCRAQGLCNPAVVMIRLPKSGLSPRPDGHGANAAGTPSPRATLPGAGLNPVLPEPQQAPV